MLFIPMSRNLYRCAYRYLSDREEAEDAVQEVYAKLWGMRSDLGKYRSEIALAMTITRNYCLDLLRSKKRRMQREYRAESDTREGDTDPQDIIERKEIFATVTDAIDKLPEQYRVAVMMRDVEGYDFEEIASELDIKLSTLRVNLSRGRKMVREQLTGIEYELAGTGEITGEILLGKKLT